jgi:hypothetical protein
MASVIRGTVRDSEGAAISGARVFYKSAPIAVPDVAILTDERGRFAMGAPAAGDYELRCVADGFAPAVVATSVGAPSEVELEIRLNPA